MKVIYVPGLEKFLKAFVRLSAAPLVVIRNS